jgi:sensor histidine kinase regulating citrate/malate metabolism
VRRLFWVALGLGAGAASAIIASRFVRKQTAKVAPANIAREARGSMLDLARLVSESINEGKVAMQERELELRSVLEDADEHAGAGVE